MLRMFIRIFISLLIFILFSTASHAEQLKFVQITDTHLSVDGENYKTRDIQSSVKNLEAAVASVNNLKDIDFVIFSGDNIDKADKLSLVKFCEITKNLNKPYYITLGNHDVFKYRGLDKDEYFKIVRHSDKYQKSKDPYYYFFPNDEFVIIVMDGVHQVIPSTHGAYSEQDLAWLDKVLTKYNNKKAIIIQHFPLIEPRENKSHRILDTVPYFKLLANHKNVIAICTGHYHFAKITPKDSIFHISSPALVESPHEYRIIEIDYNKSSLFDEKPKFNLKSEIVPLEQDEEN